MFICQVFIGAGQTNATVQDFYFSDFTGDYYLSKDEQGVSHLKVKESATAVFPDYEQNKGICRQIPFTNQNGNNVTLPRLTKDDIKVKRNGNDEPIYSIDRGDNYYDVCTGTDEYVMGKQVYTFEYEFTKVITEFNDNGREYQELYWDTNGNGASQKFEKVTARVHLQDKAAWTGDAWCYVGKYGKKGEGRCKMSEISDGMMFEAEDLKARENLTFDMEFLPNSFSIPEPEKNYTYVWLTIFVGVLCLAVIIWALRRFIKTRDKAKYYKGVFVKPEYQPSKNYSLPEMAELYIGKKKDIKVAMMLDLVVKKKIEFQKAEKNKWNIIVKDLNGVSEEYLDLLKILNNGVNPEANETIELKRRTSTSSLIALRKQMENKIVKDLKNDELVEEKYSFGGGGGYGFWNVLVISLITIPVILGIATMLFGLFDEAVGLSNTLGQEMVFSEYFFQTTFVMIVATVPIVTAFSDAAQKYNSHTKKGLEASRYMDGLKLYIEMAEADRMKMLQSVKGADTSPEGIVKLYEKLLPYAAIFGLEESWLKEMKEYCELEEVTTPDYLMSGLAASELSRSLNRASAYATTATSMSSSGGGSSSGFSGGGGGGFSGGGGGGGGFGGR